MSFVLFIGTKTKGVFNLAEKQLTLEARRELEEELEHLKVVERKDAAEKIKIARDFGDLSENAEYDEAKRNSEKIETRIQEIEAILKSAKIVDVDALSTDNVHMGCTVTVTDSKKKKIQYKIVPFAQVNPVEGKISDESPIGKALMGHKKGDKVIVELPNKTELQYKITSITK